MVISGHCGRRILASFLLLPHKTERITNRKRWLLGLPKFLAMFVLMHPLNSMTFYTDAFATFTNPVFLIATGQLYWA